MKTEGPRLRSGRVLWPHEVENRRRQAEADLRRWWVWSIDHADTEGEYAYIELEHLASDLDDLEQIVKDLREQFDQRLGVHSLRELIAKLRCVEGRTAGERESFLAKADQLERRLEADD